MTQAIVSHPSCRKCEDTPLFFVRCGVITLIRLRSLPDFRAFPPITSAAFTGGLFLFVAVPIVHHMRLFLRISTTGLFCRRLLPVRAAKRLRPHRRATKRIYEAGARVKEMFTVNEIRFIQIERA